MPRTRIPKTVKLDENDRFFWQHAGWSYDKEHGETSEHGHGLCAMMLADAERKAKRLGWHAVWAYDPEPYDGDTPYDGPMWQASLYNSGGEMIAWMGGIATDSPGARVVNAELAMSVPS